MWVQCSDRTLQSTEGQCWDATSRQLLRFPVSYILVTKLFVTGTVNDHNTVQCTDWAHPRLWSYVLVKLRSQTQAHYLEFSALPSYHGRNGNLYFFTPVGNRVLYPLVFLLAFSFLSSIYTFLERKFHHMCNWLLCITSYTFALKIPQIKKSVLSLGGPI